ncbi:hypothetical protein IIC38_02140, partial [candidate division KSB1 bacterium]|nr:hypothetical protein [candidate division KSB1 bacterium]
KQTKQTLQNVQIRLAEVDNLKMKMAQLEAYLQKLTSFSENQNSPVEISLMLKKNSQDK